MKKNKTAVIGIDGVPYELMDDLSEKGIMPNFQDLKRGGIFKKMRSSIPEISSVAWSSIITGKNPAEHGIFGLTEIIPNTYTLAFPDFSWLKTPAFWQKNSGKKYVILNVPSTYPVKKLNGVHISGFISPDLEKAVYPQEYLPYLNEINYQTDVDSSTAHKSKGLFLENLAEVNEARIKAYKYFWAKENWDVFMLVFTGSDRLEHFLFDAYEEENNPYRQGFLEYFKSIDRVIGEIASQIGEEDNLLILSDHGMERIKTNFYVNSLLEKTGFLALDRSLRGYNQISPETKAFALDPGRIYLHKKGKYQRGTVEKKDEEKIISEIIRLFEGAEYNGERVIKKVCRKGEIYKGKEFDRAPDLVLIKNPGYRLRANIGKNMLFEKDVFTGDHALDNAFFLLRDKSREKIVPQNLTVENIVSILNNL